MWLELVAMAATDFSDCEKLAQACKAGLPATSAWSGSDSLLGLRLRQRYASLRAFTMHSVAKPFPSNCGSLDLLFADFSTILRILSPIFSEEKKRKKNDETYARKRCRHNPAFSLHKKSPSYRYWNRRSSGQNCFTVTCETERWREARKGKLCWEIQSISLFHRSSLCWKDCRLRVQQNTSLTHSQRRRQVRSILVGFGLHVTGTVNKASVFDADIRAGQSERERNATREPILWRTSRR